MVSRLTQRSVHLLSRVDAVRDDDFDCEVDCGGGVIPIGAVLSVQVDVEPLSRFVIRPGVGAGRNNEAQAEHNKQHYVLHNTPYSDSLRPSRRPGRCQEQKSRH